MGSLRTEARTGGKHLVVGAVATLLSLLVFNVLVHGLLIGSAPLRDNPALGVLIANSVGMLASFPATRAWVFPDGGAREPGAQLVWFVVVNVATMAIPVLCVLLTRAAGFDDPVSDNLAANVVGTALANLARYLVYRRWLFADRDAPAPEPAARVSEHDLIS